MNNYKSGVATVSSPKGTTVWSVGEEFPFIVHWQSCQQNQFLQSETSFNKIRCASLLNPLAEIKNPLAEKSPYNSIYMQRFGVALRKLHEIFNLLLFLAKRRGEAPIMFSAITHNLCNNYNVLVGIYFYAGKY